MNPLEIIAVCLGLANVSLLVRRSIWNDTLGMAMVALQLLMEPDLPWFDDGTRCFPDSADRHRFAAIVEQVLGDAGVPFARVGGHGPARLEAARAAIGGLDD
jgi:nicotinamide riboside kinase